jgi:hypothetical protein
LKNIAIAICWCWSAAPPAASQELIPVLRGEVKNLALGEERGLWVEVENTERRHMVERTPVQVDGSFEFRGLTSGSYSVRIVTQLGGERLVEQLMTLHNSAGPLELRMPKRRDVQHPGTGIVSVRQLQVPKKAVQAFLKAQKFSASGDSAKAMEQLQEAVKLYPDFADAHGNLGVQYVRTGNYHEALAQFRLAVALRPDSAMLRTNLAYVLAALQLPADAEAELQRALAVDPKYGKAHYLLGHLLLVRPNTHRQAWEHLCAASAEVAAAQRDMDYIQTVNGAAAAKCPAVK